MSEQASMDTDPALNLKVACHVFEGFDALFKEMHNPAIHTTIKAFSRFEIDAADERPFAILSRLHTNDIQIYDAVFKDDIHPDLWQVHFGDTPQLTGLQVTRQAQTNTHAVCAFYMAKQVFLKHSETLELLDQLLGTCELITQHKHNC